MLVDRQPLIRSVKEKCRVCYTCVRECPAKAIRITDGQAEVVQERCIGCGNCVRVCSQNAKEFHRETDRVLALIDDPQATTAAIVAPSFPAEFLDVPHPRVVGMLRALGFDHVLEVAVGADLVAQAYRELLDHNDGRRYIATTCPAIVRYVENFYPELVEHLAPIVSPMVATAKVVKRELDPGARVVFVGPCFAKKGEAADQREQIDAAITFIELQELLEARGIQADAAGVAASDFDRPHPGKGVLFPIASGLLQAADIDDSITNNQALVTDGRRNFIEAIKAFKHGSLDVQLLEVLCCNGCIMGGGVTQDDVPLFRRRHAVSRYAGRRMAEVEPEGVALERFRAVMSARFTARNQRVHIPISDEVKRIMERMGKHTPEDELNCGACGYDTCREHAIAIHNGLAENEMCLPYMIDRLKNTVEELEESNSELADTKDALMQSEKLASMGQLAAGVAHEVNNPLGIVLMHANLMLEDHADNEALSEDLRVVAQQADRCKRIVSGLLDFARQNKTVLEEGDLLALVRDTRRAIRFKEDVDVAVENHMRDTRAVFDADQLAQCMTNLLTNAEAAMPQGGTITVSLRDDGDRAAIEVADEGVGISAENLTKIFDPFFTTKQIGKGTGLGLAVLYGIVKMHHGSVNVESNDDPAQGPTGTRFEIKIPKEQL